MSYFAEIDERVASLRSMLDAVEDAGRLPSVIDALGDAEAMRVIADSAAVIQAMQRAQVVAAGVIAARSTRAAGHSGLAQSRGHRTPASLLQELTGSTRTDATKSIRVGESLLESASDRAASGAASGADEFAGAAPGGDGSATAPAAGPWHAPLGAALLTGAISTSQHHAILRGLGEPPLVGQLLGGRLDGLDAESAARLQADRAEADAIVREAWALAAEQLVLEAGARTVEELGVSARAIRDRLDPEGAAERYAARFEQRSFRMYTNHDGMTVAQIVFDDEGAAWIRSVRDAALRPRRGGPRFVDSDEQHRAEQLRDDARTDEQLTYDLMLDMMRAGSLAEAEDVFGARLAGVRMVTVVDSAETTDADLRDAAVAHLEEDGGAVPGAVAEQIACTAGVVPVSVDRGGNPLHLGRSQRLFSAGQRLTLAVRDGGCRWRGCDRVASYCEAHHIDPWQLGGRTDVDRGILLCRYHHMQLHHNGWRITRDGLDDFMLHAPGRAEAIALPPRASLARAWAGIDPPLRRWRAAPAPPLVPV